MTRVASLVLAVLVAALPACRRGQESPPPAGQAPAAQAPSAQVAPTQAPAPAPAAAASAPPTDSIAEVPDYPGATRTVLVSSNESKHGFSRTVEARFSSTDPRARVVEFYQKALPERGWTVAETKNKANEIEWKLSKGTTVAEVEIRQSTGAVEIKIKRSDR
jgi:hypothetical protein